MISHRDGGRNRAVTSWRAFSPGEPVGGRCDGNRSVRLRPLGYGVSRSLQEKAMTAHLGKFLRVRN
jgi:hypothetical protein